MPQVSSKQTKKLKISAPENIQLFKTNFDKAAEGKYYNVEQFDEFITAALPHDFPITRKKKIEYIEVPASFDIETTSFYNSDGQKCAIMYIWMFSINGCVIIGRTWEEYVLFIRSLQYALSLDTAKRRLVCYIENFGFEFQFMRHYFNWNEMFAMELRRPIKALCDVGIIFKCAQYLSGMSLSGIGDNLTMFPVKKLAGDLNYHLIRNSKTQLTPQEMQYCINDVLVLQSYIYEKILTDGSITKIPMTKTGYVRRLCRDNCLYVKSNHKSFDSGKKYLRYRALMMQLTLTVPEYQLAKRVYQGGYTHGNAFFTDKIIDKEHIPGFDLIRGFDFTSSYPYCMVALKYPMTAGEDYEVKNYDDLMTQIKYYWCMFDIEFVDIEATFYYEHYISRSKCLEIHDETVDNGRVVCASLLLTSCTGEDFDIIRQTYKWKRITIYNFRRYKKYYLPRDYVLTVVDLYKKKTILKGVEGEELNYMRSKQDCNALYGNTVTDVCRGVIEYNGTEWRQTAADISASIDEYNNSKTRVISYLWGIACTAYARHNLWRAILECKEDYIYSDTDSIKLLHYIKHKQFFERYNAEVVFLLKLACSFHKIPIDDVMPRTKEGDVKILGVWDDDGEFVRMKFLGAKRYLTETKEGKLKLTVAGLHKQKAIEYLKLKYKDNVKIFEAFTNNLYIPDEVYLSNDGKLIEPGKVPPDSNYELLTPSGKNTHTYIDTSIDGYITDYQGNTAHYHEESYIHLESVEYSLSLATEYINFIQLMQSKFM